MPNNAMATGTAVGGSAVIAASTLEVGGIVTGAKLTGVFGVGSKPGSNGGSPTPPGGCVASRVGVGRGAAGVVVGRGVGVGGARANGGSAPTIALGEIERSWFLLPEPSSWRVRMCHGEPETIAAPSLGPPFERFQYADWPRWPPQASRTAEPVARKLTRMSPLLLPFGEPLWTGDVIEVMVPPQIVRRRGAAEYSSAPWTVSPSIAYQSVGNAADDGAGRPGHIEEMPPPDVAQARPAAFVTFQV